MYERLWFRSAVAEAIPSSQAALLRSMWKECLTVSSSAQLAVWHIDVAGDHCVVPECFSSRGLVAEEGHTTLRYLSGEGRNLLLWNGAKAQSTCRYNFVIIGAINGQDMGS